MKGEEKADGAKRAGGGDVEKANREWASTIGVSGSSTTARRLVARPEGSDVRYSIVHGRQWGGQVLRSTAKGFGFAGFFWASGWMVKQSRLAASAKPAHRRSAGGRVGTGQVHEVCLQPARLFRDSHHSTTTACTMYGRPRMPSPFQIILVARVWCSRRLADSASMPSFITSTSGGELAERPGTGWTCSCYRFGHSTR